MASNSANNFPAAGEGGADRALGSQQRRVRRRCRRSAQVTEEREGPGVVLAARWRGAYGAAGMLGSYRTIMEEKVSLRPSFFTWADGSRMHFFAVFDGHGGPEVSALCRDHMHAILADELARAAAAYRKEDQQDEEAEHRAWKAALTRSFVRADELGASGVPRGTIGGSTAVVALLVRGRIIVANCGDSRAVLCRAGRAVPLSEDHRLDRAEEMARVTAAGGVVFNYGGVLRVQGILAKTRALAGMRAVLLLTSKQATFLNSFATGHTLLKPEVICEPEITITARSEDDDFMILASDGLWDVMSNQVACSAAWKCLEDKSSNAGIVVGHEEEVRCIRAAFELTNLAFRMHSRDDICVVVIDLKMRG
ncbi:probable protein phosphatase 2C 37 [Triticum urartu]|uniref:probable protein phosphatase 2C 37 n=1 Tax=Triticum urartu TaxID=4572 RepID=UPI002042DF30|nr:probable protein phosphatase 2C 37 [Triticum urartu]